MRYDGVKAAIRRNNYYIHAMEQYLEQDGGIDPEVRRTKIKRENSVLCAEKIFSAKIASLRYIILTEEQILTEQTLLRKN